MMDKNTTVNTTVSIRRSFGSDANNLSSYYDQDLIGQIKIANGILNVMQSRITFVIGKIKEKDDCKRQKLSNTCLDITRVANDCKSELDELWTAAENKYLKSAALKILAFNIVTRQLLNSQAQIYFQTPAVVDYQKQLQDLVIVSQQLNEQNKKEEKLRVNLKSKLDNVIDCISFVGQKLEDYNSGQIYHGQEKRMKQRLLKTRIVQAVINCHLSGLRYNINFEQQPGLLNLKMKWRSPVKIDY